MVENLEHMNEHKGRKISISDICEAFKTPIPDVISTPARKTSNTALGKLQYHYNM